MLWLKTTPVLDFSMHGKKTNHPKTFWSEDPGTKKEGSDQFWPCPWGGAPLTYGHETGRWVACDYAVCPTILNEILDKLEVAPERDAFS